MMGWLLCEGAPVIGVAGGGCWVEAGVEDCEYGRAVGEVLSRGALSFWLAIITSPSVVG
jgi:hypothetical protein